MSWEQYKFSCMSPLCHHTYAIFHCGLYCKDSEIFFVKIIYMYYYYPPLKAEGYRIGVVGLADRPSGHPPDRLALTGTKL